jgi:NTP pyrophosphatase (non-canonical NTP hydrolase)
MRKKDLVNPWHPTTDPVELKYLGKLGEECGELGQATCRCIIQGLDGHEPTTDKQNRVWLSEEMADVLANIELNINKFGLDREAIIQQKHLKMQLLIQWHEMA